jgi:glycosyltransferase involved in cell wall biosynthesis
MREVQRHFGDVEVFVGQNIPMICPPPKVEPRMHAETWVIVALGRVQVKKNLEFGVRSVLGAIEQLGGKSKFEIRIVGPAEDQEYLQRILKYNEVSEALKVVFLGPLTPEAVSEVLYQTHYLLRPTHHENFGHAIVEAWAHGCPVFLSNNTPWRNLEGKGIGWDWPLEEHLWINGIRDAFASGKKDWEKKSRASRIFFETVVCSQDLLDANRRIFEA